MNKLDVMTRLYRIAYSQLGCELVSIKEDK